MMSVVQGGCGFPFMAQPLYNYIVHGSIKGINVSVSDIPDGTLRFIVAKVSFLWHNNKNISTLLR